MEPGHDSHKIYLLYFHSVAVIKNTRNKSNSAGMRVCACIERAEQLSALAALAQGPCSIASTHTGLTTVCNSSSLGSDAVLWPLWTPSTHMVCRHTWRQTSHAHKIKNKRTLCVTKKKPLTRSKETGKGQSRVGNIRRKLWSVS